MRNRMTVIAVTLLSLLIAQESSGDSLRKIRTAVTYISGSTIYLGAGREAGLAEGDTVAVTRKTLFNCRLIVLAVSASSASARAIDSCATLAVGDSVRIDKLISIPSNVPGTSPLLTSRTRLAAEQRVTGSAAVQFSGVTASDLGWTYAEPTLLLRLSLNRLFDGAFTLTFNGRTSYDMAPASNRLITQGRYRMRIYTFSLTTSDPGAPIGFGVGRIWSSYLSGLGTLDGAQFTLSQGNFTIGAIAGFQPDVRTSEFDQTHQKFAAFASYSVTPSSAGSGRFSLGYGQQLYRGKPDRDFLYIQSNWNVSLFSLVQSTELDLHRLVDGERTSQPRLTNTYLSLSAQPISWLGMSVGYDATRPVFLFETMRDIPDTLFDSDLYQGIRTGITVRLPGNVLLLGQGSVRSSPGSGRTSRNGGGSLRFLNVVKSGFNVGAQLLWNSGAYTEGMDYSFTVDRWFDNGLSFSLRAGQYWYMPRGFGERTTATTMNANLTWATQSGWYWTGSVDQTWDPSRGSTRILAEVGIHF